MQQRKELRKAGLKITLPRLKILEILEGSELRHLSAEDIYKELLQAREDIGLATVYRVLAQFDAAGLVIRHNFEGGHSVFELDEGFVCTKSYGACFFASISCSKTRNLLLIYCKANITN